jgi:hypothetical protein
MISNIENLIALFNKMNRDGFDTNNPLKWGFYFVDRDKQKLQKAFEELKEEGYTLENFI